MLEVNAEINTLKQEMKKTDSDLVLLYRELGKVGSIYHLAINCSDSNTVYNEICSLVYEHEELKKKIITIEIELEKKEKNTEEIKIKQDKIKELDKQFVSELTLLGAVAYEVYKVGNLSEKFNFAIQIFEDFEKKNNKSKPLFGVFKTLADKNRQQSYNRIFTEVGLKLYKNKCKIQSDRAKQLYAELDEISEKKESLKQIITQKRELINNLYSTNSQSLKPGEISRVMKEYSAQRKQNEKILNEKYTEYGQIIATTMNLWLDEYAPEQLKNICYKIIEKLKKQKRQSLNLSYFESEKKFNINQTRISGLESQLQLLYKQRKNLDKQISLIKEEIEQIQTENEDIEKNQTEIKNLAKSIENNSFERNN